MPCILEEARGAAGPRPRARRFGKCVEHILTIGIELLLAADI
ncbi:MAG: hypothetical protein AB8I08_14190 [Sandaracinaceae bacterium]